MKYTFEEYQKLRKDHDKEMECLDWIDGNDYVKLYNRIYQLWKENPDSFCVTLSRPVITLDNFKNDMGFYKWLTETFKEPNNRPIFGWWPRLGMWSFYTKKENLIKFNNEGEWKDEIVYNIKTIDLWTGGAEFTMADDHKEYMVFDEIEFNVG